MKILWHSNSPLVPTGYGQQTNLFTRRLAAHHDVAVSCFYGLEGAPIMWHDVPLFPGLGGEFGNQYIAGHASAFFGGDPRNGIILTLMDVLAMSKDVYSGLNTVCWTPVDHDPATPTQRDFFANSAAIPIAMSRYGQERLAEFDPLYCPHAVETDIFKPLDRRKVREDVGVDPDAFIVGVVAANKGNPSRKCFVEILQAFARLRERHDNAILYLHTEISGTVSHGVPIGEVAGALGIPPDAIARADQYRLLFSPYPPDEMAAIFSSFDVLASPSAGEGFGIPCLEAQSCGVPVIASDHSAMREVVQAGWHVGGQRVFTGQHSWQIIPSVDEIHEAMEECYALPSAEREALSDEARRHALGYDIDKVLDDFMLPALEEVEERVGERPALAAV